MPGGQASKPTTVDRWPTLVNPEPSTVTSSPDLNRVTLEVDADSSTGADQLYLSLGWRTSYVTQSWHRDVPVDP